MVTCSMCGTEVESGGESGVPPLTWVCSVEDGRSRWYCDECSRTHLRAMEAKLDSEWW